MKVLLAVDGSRYTKKMLACLVSHEQWMSGLTDVVLLNIQAPLPPRVSRMVGAGIAADYHRDESEKVLGPAAKFLARHGVNPRSEWKVGPAGETIAKFAKSGKFDLVIMGSHGHGSLGTLVLGSVANKVLASCDMPVMLVR